MSRRRWAILDETPVSMVVGIKGQSANLPRRELSPYIVCGADESRLGQGAAKNHQLSQTDGTGLFCDPAVTEECEHKFIASGQRSRTEADSRTHPGPKQDAMPGSACVNTAATATSTGQGTAHVLPCPRPPLASLDGRAPWHIAARGATCRRCHAARAAAAV